MSSLEDAREATHLFRKEENKERTQHFILSFCTNCTLGGPNSDKEKYVSKEFQQYMQKEYYVITILERLMKQWIWGTLINIYTKITK